MMVVRKAKKGVVAVNETKTKANVDSSDDANKANNNDVTVVKKERDDETKKKKSRLKIFW